MNLIRNTATLPVLALLCALLAGCGPDGVAQLKQVRHPVDDSRTLERILGGYPYFARVSWSASPLPAGGERARATGIFDLDKLVGRASEGKGFSAADRSSLNKAGANLCYVIEYDFDSASPQGRLVQQAVMIVTMDWTQPAPLANDAILREIALGSVGPALLTAATDAAAYSRARMAVQNKK